jgi:hypothetical protein
LNPGVFDIPSNGGHEMSTGQQSDQTEHGVGFSRRAALVRGGATGVAAAALAALGLRQRTLAQEMTPMAAPAGWKAQHVEVSVVPHDPVSITLAGSGPPQRGDHFYIDAPIYAKGDEGGTEIGIYRCFGAWVAAADATDAPAQRLTTVQYVLSTTASSSA